MHPAQRVLADIELAGTVIVSAGEQARPAALTRWWYHPRRAAPGSSSGSWSPSWRRPPRRQRLRRAGVVADPGLHRGKPARRRRFGLCAARRCHRPMILQQFRPKRSPVCRKKMRQNRELERFHASYQVESALGAESAAAEGAASMPPGLSLGRPFKPLSRAISSRRSAFSALSRALSSKTCANNERSSARPSSSPRMLGVAGDSALWPESQVIACFGIAGQQHAPGILPLLQHNLRQRPSGCCRALPEMSSEITYPVHSSTRATRGQCRTENAVVGRRHPIESEDRRQ
jgi:hypothetical protein